MNERWFAGAVCSLGVLACSDAMTTTDGGSDAAAMPDVAAEAAPLDAGQDAGGIPADVLAELKKLTPLGPVPADTTNKYADDPKAAYLGQMLFYDKSYSGALIVGDNGMNGGLGAQGEAGKVSCHSCHGVGGQAMDDQRSKPNNVSLGTNFGTRNALGIINSGYYQWTNWGGRFDSQWSLAVTVAENPNIMNGTRLQIAHLLWNKYRKEYDAAFTPALDADLDPNAANASRFPASGKPGQSGYDNVTAGDKAIIDRIFVNFGKALHAYMRKLVSANAPFDRWMAGETAAISAAAQRGAQVFIKAKCEACHSGPRFSDDAFHALGVPQIGPNVPALDNGRFQDVPPLLASGFNSNGAFSDNTSTGKLTGLMQDASQKGQFRTKSLRNVAQSGPFMHSGQHATLAEVVDFYDQGGGDVGDAGAVKDPKIVKLGLSAQEKMELVEFMKTLTGEPIAPALLQDTSK